MDHSILFKTASVLCLSLGFAASAYATPINTIKDYTIWDNHNDADNKPTGTENQYSYWGGNAHSYDDVIGSYKKFDIQKAVINRYAVEASSFLTVDIYTNFASSTGGLGKYKSSTTNNMGIGLGDLFLTSDWRPTGTAENHYQEDNLNTTGTSWDYVVSLGDNRWNTSGKAEFFKITNTNSYLTSNHFLKPNSTFRDHQLIAVDRTVNHNTEYDNGLENLNNSARWDTYSDPGVIRFTMDISGTTLETGAFGIHWGMTCGNDVIEGDPPAAVPEPASMSLLSLGLIGMGFVSLRRRVNKK